MKKHKQRKTDAEAVAHSIIEFFDEQVSELTLDEYGEVIDIVGAHIDSCKGGLEDDLKMHEKDLDE